MRKYLILALLAIFTFTSPLAAQNKNRGKDREEMKREIQEFKLKFLAQEMDLEESKQKQFFELYTQMEEEKLKVIKDTKALEKKLKDAENATDAEYETVSKAITAAKEKEAEIEKRYDEKFSQFLSPRQIFKMKSAEQKFRDKMREMRRNKCKSKK
ncbi:MAG: hypothetical protein ACI4AK_08175 [Lepagella sp.]